MASMPLSDRELCASVPALGKYRGKRSAGGAR